MNLERTLNLRLRHAPKAVLREEAFGAMLVAGNLPVLSLNKDALRIWELLDGTKSVAEVECLLEQEYESEVLRPRLLTFLDFCLTNGLLEESDGPRSA